MTEEFPTLAELDAAIDAARAADIAAAYAAIHAEYAGQWN